LEARESPERLDIDRVKVVWRTFRQPISAKSSRWAAPPAGESA
jgi:hypothetical protein